MCSDEFAFKKHNEMGNANEMRKGERKKKIERKNITVQKF